MFPRDRRPNRVSIKILCLFFFPERLLPVTVLVRMSIIPDTSFGGVIRATFLMSRTVCRAIQLADCHSFGYRNINYRQLPTLAVGTDIDCFDCRIDNAGLFRVVKYIYTYDPMIISGAPSTIPNSRHRLHPYTTTLSCCTPTSFQSYPPQMV